MNTRARFEEIWPVPEGVEWRDSFVGYAPMHSPSDDVLDTCIEWDIRLDTFARCQETTDVYVSLIQEMVDELSSEPYPGSWYFRAQKLLEQNK